MFSDRYHLTGSTLAWVCPLNDRCHALDNIFQSLKDVFFVLLLNIILKVRAVYFKADSTVSGTFQCSTCLVSAPLFCPASTINFLDVKGPFSDEVGPCRVIWRNCCLIGSVGPFSQILKLLAQLMALRQWGRFSFLMGGSQWCCLSKASLEKNLVHLLHLFWFLSIKNSIGCSICCISSSVVANVTSRWASVQLKCCSKPLLMTWFKK